MAFCVVAEMPNGTQEQYEAVSKSVGVTGPNPDMPQGLLSHVAGPLDGGGWCVITEWESRQDFERFREERLRQAVANAGFGPPVLRTFEVFREYHSAEQRTARAA